MPQLLEMACDRPGDSKINAGFPDRSSSVLGSGPFKRILAANGNPEVLREYTAADGHAYFDVRNEKNERVSQLVSNAPATLRFQDWRRIDESVITVVKPRLKLIGDLRGRGLEYALGNGMAFTILSYEDVSDISPASINMDGIVQANTDRPVFDMKNLPLPIIHKDFQFSLRQILASRNGLTPLDMVTPKLAARRVAEGAEQLAAGVWPTYAFGGANVYGLVNFPKRITKTMTAPTAGGWTPAILINEILAMRQLAVQAFHFGPYVLYTSINWDPYLDIDYSAAKGDNTLRARLKAIADIQDVVSLDYLQFLTGTPYTMVLVQMSDETIEEVIGMDIITLEWETHGGMMLNFKVMCIMVPRLRADQNNNCGIIHGSAVYP